MPKKPSNYNCSQPVLYGALRRGWNSAIMHLTAFTAFTATYGLDSINDQLTAVDDAEKMKTGRQLQAAVNKVRIELDLCKAAFFEAFQELKRYITLTYKPPFREANFVEAGAGYYKKASGNNWDALSNLLKASGEFIVNHKSALLAGNKMPATFPDLYINKIKVVNDTLKKWGELQDEKPASLSEKLSANNALYTACIEMMGVGQQIFSKKKSIKREFTFTQVCRAVRGSSGIAGLKGSFTSSVTGLSLPGVFITSADGKYTATTDKKGKFHMTQILAGTYLFTVEMMGYTPVSQQIILKPGVTSNLKLSLVPIALLKAA